MKTPSFVHITLRVSRLQARYREYVITNSYGELFQHAQRGAEGGGFPMLWPAARPMTGFLCSYSLAPYATYPLGMNGVISRSGGWMDKSVRDRCDAASDAEDSSQQRHHPGPPNQSCQCQCQCTCYRSTLYPTTKRSHKFGSNEEGHRHTLSAVFLFNQ